MFPMLLSAIRQVLYPPEDVKAQRIIKKYGLTVFDPSPTDDVLRNFWQYSDPSNFSTGRYSTINATKQSDTLTYNGIVLTRLSMNNFYSSLRSAINGLGLTPFTVGYRYLISCYVATQQEQFLWMRSLTDSGANGHGAKYVGTTPTRIWILAQATSSSQLTVVKTPTIALGSEAGGDVFWIAQNSTEGGASECFIGGFQVEKVLSTYKDGIALIGDSTMAGSSGGIDSCSTTAREVSTWMGALLNVNVYNRAVGGNRLSDMDVRWATDISPLAVNCKYVVIQGGINDISNGSSLAACQSSINSMVSKAATDSLTPVIFTCSPATSIAANSAYESIRVALNDWIKANFSNVVDIASALSDPVNPSILNQAWQGDGVHYLSAGKKLAGILASGATFWDFITPTTYQVTPQVITKPTGTCYSDSACSLPAVQDGVIGGIVDSNATLGPELVTNGDMSSTTGWTLDKSGGGTTPTISGGTLNFASATTDYVYARQTFGAALTIGKVYKISCTSSVSVGDLGLWMIGAGAVQILNFLPSNNGTRQIYFVATGAFTGFEISRNSGASTATFDNLTIKEVTGYIATQSTAGYKPILRKGAKNKLLDSATLSTQNVTTAAVAHTLQFKGTGTVTLSGTSTAGPLVGTGANDLVTLTFTPTAGTLTLTVSGSVTSAMLNTGTTAEPYVATTTVPLSNGVGSWRMDFDSDDALTMTAISGASAATIVRSLSDGTQTTQTGVDCTSGLTLNTNNLAAMAIFKSAPPANDLAIIQKYIKKLAAA